MVTRRTLADLLGWGLPEMSEMIWEATGTTEIHVKVLKMSGQDWSHM